VKDKTRESSFVGCMNLSTQKPFLQPDNEAIRIGCDTTDFIGIRKVIGQRRNRLRFAMNVDSNVNVLAKMIEFNFILQGCSLSLK
jgi:hypothetical protein